MNILLIQADQQRRDMLGVYGNPVVRTPAIDRLASEGMVFDYAFTPTPICGPARASLITGLWPRNHGILVNLESGSVAGRDFIGEHATLAELLAAGDYRSVLCGKWHVGSNLPPEKCGFEGVFYPGYGYPKNHPHYLDYLKKLGTTFKLREEMYSPTPDGHDKTLLAAVQKGPAEVAIPHYLVDQAIAAIKQSAKSGQPFFIRCDFWGPHAPYIVPEPYASMYDPQQIEPWPNFDDSLTGKPEIQRAYRRYWGIENFTWDEWSRLVAMCYGYCTLIDDEVARMRAALAESGVADNTVIFYTSDHGGMVGAHDLADKGPYLYDEICRIPFVAYVPGLPAGRRSDALVYNMDLMPTLLDLAGCEVPSGLDAVSFMPVLKGEHERVRQDDTVYMEFHGHHQPYSQRLVRTRRAKYIYNPAEIDELYDLEHDPHELHNRAADPAYADHLNEMRQIMRQWLEKLNDPVLKFFDGERLASYLPPH
ncbi:MAG: sulfatase-like hydrolase/transferase [Planctomycetota bacterium]|jgi:arylsulfatase A-like enzyme